METLKEMSMPDINPLSKEITYKDIELYQKPPIIYNLFMILVFIRLYYLIISIKLYLIVTKSRVVS